MTGSRLIIKSKIRFTIFLAILIIGAAIGLNMIFSSVEASAENNSISYRTVQVCDGDTLWTIANRYYPDEDTRKAVYEIQQLNDMSSSETLTAGSEIKVPTN